MKIWKNLSGVLLLFLCGWFTLNSHVSASEQMITSSDVTSQAAKIFREQTFYTGADDSEENTASLGLTLTGIDDEGSLCYEFGDFGGITTNIKEGTTAEFGFLEFSDTLTYQMMLDGNAYNYENGDLLLDSGNYVVFIYPKEDLSIFTTFAFSIKNDAFASDDSWISDYTGGEVSDNSWDLNQGNLNNNDPQDLNFNFDFGYGSQENIEDMLGGYTGIEIDESKMDFKYSEELGNLLFYVGDVTFIKSNIPNGSIVTNPVQVTPASGITQYVYHNGVLEVTPEEYIYKEPGYYEIVSTTFKTPEGSEDTMSRIMVQTIFRFTIIDSSARDYNVVSAPEDFVMDRVVYQGKEQEIPESGYFFLGRDGKYVFHFTCLNDSALTSSLEIDKDTVAPFVSFSQDITGGPVKAPLTFTCDDANAKIQVYRDNQECLLSGQQIEYGGVYYLVATDSHGNSREYEFSIKTEYHFFSPGMVVILVIIVLMLAFFMLYKRGQMQVK